MTNLEKYSEIEIGVDLNNSNEMERITEVTFEDIFLGHLKRQKCIEMHLEFKFRSEVAFMNKMST